MKAWKVYDALGRLLLVVYYPGKYNSMRVKRELSRKGHSGVSVIQVRR